MCSGVQFVYHVTDLCRECLEVHAGLSQCSGFGGDAEGQIAGGEADHLQAVQRTACFIETAQGFAQSCMQFSQVRPADRRDGPSVVSFYRLTQPERWIRHQPGDVFWGCEAQMRR